MAPTEIFDSILRIFYSTIPLIIFARRGLSVNCYLNFLFLVF